MSPLAKWREGILMLVGLGALVLAVWSLRGEPLHLCRDAVWAPVCEVKR